MSRHLIEELQFNSREAMLTMQPAPSGQEPGGLSVRKLVEAVFRSRWLVILTTGLGFAIGAFMAITTPNSYVSQGNFMFTQSGSESISVDPLHASESNSASISLNATYIFNAEPLLLRVVRQVTPERILAPYAPGSSGSTGWRGWFHRMQADWSGSGTPNEDDAMKRLKRGLVVDKPRFSDMLLVSYSANDEKLARDVLQTYMVEAIKWHLEVYDDQKRFDEVESSQKRAAAELKRAKEALEAFHRDNAITNFDFELLGRRAEEQDAATAMHKNQNDIESWRMQISAAAKALELTPPTRLVRKPRVESEGMKLYQAQQIKLEIERAGLAIRTTDPANDRKVQEVDRELENVNRLIEALSQAQLKLPVQEYEEDNPDYREALIQKAKLQSQLLGAESITEANRERHEKKHVAVTKLLQLEPEFRRLQESMKRAEEEANRADTAQAVATRKRLLKEGNFSSLQRMEPASLPLEKEGPNRMKLVMAGVLAGLFLALGLVIMRSLPDRIVRVREDLERLGGAPVIGVVPRQSGRNVRRHQVRRDQGW